MSSQAFDRLLYTDCRAGMGRGAGGGFQVQAQSAGVDPAQARMVVGWLLYDAQTAWIMQRHAVEDFPLGFAHACDEGYGTAQSCYLGKEATGGREGNHLADCLLTHDAGLYGPTRPVQLWRSELWRSEPWATKDCPQFDGMPPLGPLTIDMVTEWLRERPERRPVLARLLSVLEDPAGRRVVIVATRPDDALTWIAAGTLLLPVSSALTVSFKVFCSNPHQASQRIVAVPRDLNPQIAPGRGDPAFVLDAEGCASDDAGISERAGFWAGQLATADDPYDVVDAVELAEALAAGGGTSAADAMLTAWAVTVPDAPLADPPVLFRWLSAAGLLLQQEHGASVVRRILTGNPPVNVLRWIDAAGAAGRIPIDRLEVRGLLLTAEITEVRGGSDPRPELLAPLDPDASARRDADSELSSAIVLEPDAQCERLLRLGRRHHVEMQLAPLLQRLHAFVLAWLDDPRPGYQPADWALRENILDLAYDELQIRLANRGPAGIRETLRRLWPHFADRRANPAEPLDCHLLAAEIRALPSAERPPRVQALIEDTLRLGQRDTMIRVQRTLLNWEALGTVEATLVLMMVPDSVPIESEIIDLTLREVIRSADRPTEPMLDALAAVHRRGKTPPGHPFPELIAADRCVMGFIEATRSDRFKYDESYLQLQLDSLAEADPAVLRARLTTLVRASLDCREWNLGIGLMNAVPAQQRRAVIDRWARELDGQWSTQAAVWGVAWCDHRKLAKDFSIPISGAIREHVERLSPGEREEWILSVEDLLTQDRVKIWEQLAGYEAAKQPRKRRLRSKEGG